MRQLRSSTYAASLQPLIASSHFVSQRQLIADMLLSGEQVVARGAFNPMSALARALLVLNPAAALRYIPPTRKLFLRPALKDTSKRLEHSLVAMTDRTLHGGSGDSRLHALRAAMGQADVNAFVVPSNDPHLSEYVHPAYQRRAFISGFTGSAGTAVITDDSALLWTDGRYFLQAEQELSNEWKLMRMGQPGVPTMEAWLAQNLPAKARLGIDPLVHSVDEAKGISSALEEANRELSLVPLSGSPNLVDLVWESNRPSLPKSLARSLPLEVSGKAFTEKLADVGRALAENNASTLLVCSLDEVCWLLNLRGADIPYCPVLQAYVLVHHEASTGATTATLFVDAAKISEELRKQLESCGVAIAAYEEIEGAVRTIDADGGVIMLDPKTVNYGLRLAAGDRAVLTSSPITLPKAMKNDAEIAGMQEAHLADGAAVANFFGWLRRTVVDEKTPQTEVEIAKKLAQFRAEQPGFLDLSFSAIVGVGSNGAIIHYDPCNADAASVRTLDGSEMMLLDSGGQYATGTTDVTRTIHLGEPTAWQRECFTRVLKGHIALDKMVFPEGTPGMALDAFARCHLWSAGLDYLHGTGHGVGAALNVHEGPHSISKRYYITEGLREGMICSNEPGYYEPGKFGIRIENLLVIRKRPTPNSFDNKSYLGFDQLTHIPIQMSLVDVSLLTADEVHWLDSYHARVWDRISPRLAMGSDGYTWLQEATWPLEKQIQEGHVRMPSADRHAATFAK